MDFKTHLCHRNEIVVIFLDVDASLYNKDLELRTFSKGSTAAADADTLAASATNGSNTSNSLRRSADGRTAAATEAETGPVGSTHRPQTRFDVIVESVKSFYTQKERTSPLPTKLRAAVYLVEQDKVTAAAPLFVCGAANALEGALKKYLERYAALEGSGSKGSSTGNGNGAFPFRAISTILKDLELQVAAESTEKQYTIIQGLVMLSRQTAPPTGPLVLLPRSSVSAGLRSSHVGAAQAPKTKVWLDVVCMAPLHLPMSPRKPRALDLVPQGSGSNAAAMIAAASATAEGQTEVEHSCLVIDPSDFTGVSHRGMAVGITLTKLLALQDHGDERFLHRRLCMVKLQSPNSVEPRAAANGVACDSPLRTNFSVPTKPSTTNTSTVAATPTPVTAPHPPVGTPAPRSTTASPSTNGNSVAPAHSTAAVAAAPVTAPHPHVGTPAPRSTTASPSTNGNGVAASHSTAAVAATPVAPVAAPPSSSSSTNVRPVVVSKTGPPSLASASASQQSSSLALRGNVAAALPAARPGVSPTASLLQSSPTNSFQKAHSPRREGSPPIGGAAAAVVNRRAESWQPTPSKPSTAAAAKSNSDRKPVVPPSAATGVKQLPARRASEVQTTTAAGQPTRGLVSTPRNAAPTPLLPLSSVGSTSSAGARAFVPVRNTRSDGTL